MLIGACHPRLSALIPRLQDYPAGTEANTRAMRQLNFIILFGPFLDHLDHFGGLFLPQLNTTHTTPACAA